MLLETLILFSIIGTFSGLWLLRRIDLSVDSTLNDAEDHWYEAWRVAEGRVYQFGCTVLEAADALLKFITSKCVLVSKLLN